MSFDYKKIIKSRDARLRILRMLSFVPDRQMIEIQYRMKTGRKLRLDNPQRFTEKLQWYKLYYKNPLMIQCVDKFDVRKYVKNKGLEDILVPCYGVYDTVGNINWNDLPDKFVMKDTLGGGGASVEIVEDMNKVTVDRLKELASKWTRIDAHIKNGGREWPYYSGKNHRVIFEQYIDSDLDKGGLIDYKFFCFYGKPEYVYVIADRQIGKNGSLGIFDNDFNQLQFWRTDERPLKQHVDRPENYDRMLEIAHILSESFPEVRVDLYDQDGRIMFGELTFFDGSGYMSFEPDNFDYIMGRSFALPHKS